MDVEKFTLHSVIQLGIFGIISALQSVLFGVGYYLSFISLLPFILTLGSSVLSSSIVMFIEARLEQKPSIEDLKREFNFPGQYSYVLNLLGIWMFFIDVLSKNTDLLENFIGFFSIFAISTMISAFIFTLLRDGGKIKLNNIIHDSSKTKNG